MSVSIVNKKPFETCREQSGWSIQCHSPCHSKPALGLQYRYDSYKRSRYTFLMSVWKKEIKIHNILPEYFKSMLYADACGIAVHVNFNCSGAVGVKEIIEVGNKPANVNYACCRWACCRWKSVIHDSVTWARTWYWNVTRRIFSKSWSTYSTGQSYTGRRPVHTHI